jgi:hypothetical protein
MPVTLVVGGQWGDEGKAKIIDYLARGTDYVVRYQGGANAGHTVVVGKEKFAFRQVPSGILYPRVTCVLGGGMVIDPWALIEEINGIAARGVEVEGRILVSEQAHLVLPYHVLLDCESEDRRSSSVEGGIGTTRKGISPAYADKARREGIRASDLTRSSADLRQLVEAHVRENNKILKLRGAKTLSPKQVADDVLRVRKPLLKMITDTRPVLWNAVEEGKHVLCEGAQGSLLDIDHGTYPFVTSSNTTAGFAGTGTGLGPRAFDAVLGIVSTAAISLAMIGLSASALFTIATMLTPNKYIALVFLALSYAGSDFMLPTAWAVCLDIGKKYAGAVTGAMNTAGQIGSFISSVCFGYIVRFSGSYDLPLVPITVMLAISAALWLKIDATEALIPP